DPHTTTDKVTGARRLHIGVFELIYDGAICRECDVRTELSALTEMTQVNWLIIDRFPNFHAPQRDMFVNRLIETGSVIENMKPDVNRRVLAEEGTEEIGQKESRVSQFSAWNASNLSELKPCKLALVQELQPRDISRSGIKLFLGLLCDSGSILDLGSWKSPPPMLPLGLRLGVVEPSSLVGLRLSEAPTATLARRARDAPLCGELVVELVPELRDALRLREDVVRCSIVSVRQSSVEKISHSFTLFSTSHNSTIFSRACGFTYFL
ncbi:hypothetical protein C0J52_00936, partial [Blattella germanica]